MKIILLTIILMLTFSLISAVPTNEELNEFACAINEYAKIKINLGQSLLECNKE